MTTADRALMERALFLGECGRGRTSPNPSVGAVVVSPGGVVVGHGVTQEPGGPHAEVVALNRAGDLAAGATLYCTLEPCNHVGRTGPCVERVVAAGVRRVVAATRDRNPLTSGRGFAYLRAHGIDVVEDVEHEAAERQHAPFFTWITRRRPFVIAKVVTSADGFVGQRAARVRLTGADADRYFHRQRAEIDAIAVGSGTVLADDPELTARGAYRFRPLTRVIFDWRGRVPETARVFTTVEAGPVIMVVSRSAAAAQAERFQRMSGRGVAILDSEARDVAAVLTRLARREIVSLLVEGGPRLHAEFAEANAIDRVQHVITPHRLTEGIPAAPTVPDALRPPGREKRLGDDILMEFDVHRID